MPSAAYVVAKNLKVGQSVVLKDVAEVSFKELTYIRSALKMILTTQKVEDGVKISRKLESYSK